MLCSTLSTIAHIIQERQVHAMDVKSSSHATYKIGYHIIWCTKFRHEVLIDAIEVKAKRCIAEAHVAYGWKIPSLEVMPDHVHCFVQAPPTVAPVDIV